MIKLVFKGISVVILLFTLFFLISISGVGKKIEKFIQPEREYHYHDSVYPDEIDGIPVHHQLIDIDGSARTGETRVIKYIVIHETDNYASGAGALNHATYLSKNNQTTTSWHYTVDDKEIYHHIPDNEVAHHAGVKDGNSYGIGIELCVNEDGDFEKTLDNAAKLVAYLLKAYDLEITDIKTHHDFSGKDCPHIILANHRWDEFLKKVEDYLEQE